MSRDVEIFSMNNVYIGIKPIKILFCILTGVLIAALDTPIIYALAFWVRKHFGLKGAGVELEILN